ncbi:hypothetical protein [Pseudomonas sp. Q11]|nr:hypothetical protein [Pseudomonas sp. Q11]
MTDFLVAEDRPLLERSLSQLFNCAMVGNWMTRLTARRSYKEAR